MRDVPVEVYEAGEDAQEKVRKALIEHMRRHVRERVDDVWQRLERGETLREACDEEPKNGDA